MDSMSLSMMPRLHLSKKSLHFTVKIEMHGDRRMDVLSRNIRLNADSETEQVGRSSRLFPEVQISLGGGTHSVALLDQAPRDRVRLSKMMREQSDWQRFDEALMCICILYNIYQSLYIMIYCLAFKARGFNWLYIFYMLEDGSWPSWILEVGRLAPTAASPLFLDELLSSCALGLRTAERVLRR